MTKIPWDENALVKRAARLAEEAGEPTTLRTLEELLGIMNELEDRFPGVPFGELLADPAPKDGYDIRRMRATLKRNGACDADIALVCPRADDLALISRRNTLTSDPYDTDGRLSRGGAEAGRL